VLVTALYVRNDTFGRGVKRSSIRALQQQHARQNNKTRGTAAATTMMSSYLLTA
jgi:hypothetical protein